MDSLRLHAEVLARALELGVISVTDAVAWADSVIEVQDHPHWSICEIATAKKKHPTDVASMLREVPGSFDEQLAYCELLNVVSRGLEQDHGRADRLARALFDLAIAGKIQDKELSDIAFWAWDAIDLAEAGMIPESRSDVVSQMLTALKNAAHRSTNQTTRDASEPG